jgi:hypothetical protein
MARARNSVLHGRRLVRPLKSPRPLTGFPWPKTSAFRRSKLWNMPFKYPK